MARRKPFRASRARSVALPRRATQSPLRRQLRFEPLEERRLLASVTVGNLFDVVNGNVTSIADLIAGDGGDGISLREAILATNATAGADEITFDAALAGTTITLGGTQLAITEALVIDGRPLAANLTIDANQQSRIFDIRATTDDFTLGGLTLTGGRTTASGSASASRGGAIRSLTTGNLTLDQSTVSGNSTTGNYANGGGIGAYGAVTLTYSTVSGNSTAGDSADGGGIFTFGAVTLTQSTVSGNSTAQLNAIGGGVYQANTSSNDPFSISGSIVAGNTAGGGGTDLVPDPQSTLTVNYSLIGTGIAPTAGGNNVVTDNPQLGLLGNNGGPTETHALLASSPAIDAGDPSFMGPPNFDQRGFAYSRVIGGRIDMGAFEFGAASADFDEDGNVDGLDFLAWQRGFGIAAPNAAKADGDADNDTDVDGADLAFWELQYGTPPGPLIAEVSAAVFATEGPALASLKASDETPFATKQDTIDAAIALSLLEHSSDAAEETVVDDRRAAVEASYDSAFDASDSGPAAVRIGEADSPTTLSIEGEDAEEPWLSDELLECVFG